MSRNTIPLPRIMRPLRLGIALLLLLGLYMGASALLAQGETPPPVVLTDEQGEYSLAPYLEILRDPTRGLTIQDVSSPAFSSRFFRNQQDSPSLGFTSDAVWLRFRVENRATSSNDWVLALDDLRHGSVGLYLPNEDGSFEVRQTGRNFAFSTRDVPNRVFVFRLDVPPDREQVFYMRLLSVTPITMPLKIWSTRALSEHDQQDVLLYGLFYGAMLMMAAFNLFLFASLRDKSYLFLALFIITYSLNQSQRDGISQQYLFPNISNRYIGELAGALFGAFFVLYAISLLDTRTRIPRIHRILIAIAIAFPVWFISSFFLSTNALANVLFLVSYFFLGLAGYLVLRQGYRPARLYLISWFFFVAVAVLFFLNNLYPVLGYLIDSRPFLPALALGALFGSLALADRVNLLKWETEETNRELESSEQKYHSLFDNSRDGIFISTRDGKIVDANPTMLDMFGMVRSDLDKLNARDLYANPAQRDELLSEIEKRGYIQDYPLEFVRFDGTPMLALVTTNEWRDEQTGQKGYQSVVRDMTKQRNLEAELADQVTQREQAVAAERGRLARDLHDSVTQGLYSIGLYANAADRSLRHKKQSAAASHIKQIIQLALEAMVDMRSLIFELQPPVLAQLGLASALKIRLQAVEGRAGVAVEFHSSGEDGLSPTTQSELYHIAQEALTNVVKHAQAEHVWVNLDYTQDHAALEIRDDGNGFDPADVQQKNTMGLRSIAERAQKIEGVLTVESKPGQGTRIRIEVPYE